MRLLIVEDNPSYLVEIEMNLSEIEGVTTKVAKNGESALSLLNEGAFDLVVLDLMLDGSLNDSLEIAEKASCKSIPFVILTGRDDSEAYDRFFEYLPIGYFTKPLDKTAFRYIIDSHRELLKNSKNDEGLIFESNAHLYTFIKKRKRLFKLNYSDIRTVKADGNYLSISTVRDKYVVRFSLAKFMANINYKNLVQIHRNYVVNVEYVESLKSDFTTLEIGGASIPIGRTYKAELKKQINRI